MSSYRTRDEMNQSEVFLLCFQSRSESEREKWDQNNAVVLALPRMQNSQSWVFILWTQLCAWHRVSVHPLCVLGFPLGDIIHVGSSSLRFWRIVLVPEKDFLYAMLSCSKTIVGSVVNEMFLYTRSQHGRKESIQFRACWKQSNPWRNQSPGCGREFHVYCHHDKTTDDTKWLWVWYLPNSWS